jgi:hypothetical protein
MKAVKNGDDNAKGRQEVADFLKILQHPFKAEIEAVRKIVLGANKDLTEHIKWNAPSFAINGEDRITFNLQGKGFFRLIFHCGAKARDRKSDTRLIEDTTGLLEWASPDRAIAKFGDMEDVRRKKDALVSTINKWLDKTV